VSGTSQLGASNSNSNSNKTMYVAKKLKLDSLITGSFVVFLFFVYFIGSILYVDCQDRDHPETYESRSETHVYVVPETQRFLQIQPEFFLRSKELELFFDVDFNAVDICWSRVSPEEYVSNESFKDMHEKDIIEKDETRRENKKEERKKNKEERKEEDVDLDSKECQSVNAGKRAKFLFKKPCEGQSVTRCRPIFFQIQGKDGGGTNCITPDYAPCRTANSALLTITHRGMACGAGRSLVPTTITIMFALMVISTSFSV
jgi:hypothetical protein